MSKSILSLILLLSVMWTGANAQYDSALRPAYALISRVVPGHVNDFTIEKINTDNGKDVFELESVNGKIVLRGNSSNSIAVALHYYLKYYCKSAISWYVDENPELPVLLPVIPVIYRSVARSQHRFFLNYCTFGYSMPWWKWKDWEQMIDWMAMNGINMPLAITGEEAIWYEVWKKMGLTDEQIRGFFTGPAHLPWHRMANLDHWQGPLPMSYIREQEDLQKKILARERELDMKPVLPAFAGHVPKILETKYPKAKISSLGSWNEFPDQYDSYFLDPLDPLFKNIQKEFLKIQTREYGTDHIYGTDPFNEVKPPSWDTAYLATVSHTIYSSMHEQDSAATWLMMTWLYYYQRELWTNDRIKSFLNAIPKNKILLLDYFCENTEVWKMTDRFYGQPFIWCYLGNFGGNTMLTGNPAVVNERLENTFTSAGNGISGIGSTLEGLDVNPVMYDYVFEKAWTGNSLGLDDWMKDYADMRCGQTNGPCRMAWKLLMDSVYIGTAKPGQGTLTDARPALTGFGNWTTDTHIDYQNAVLLTAWEYLLQAPETNRNSYQYDLVNIGRQLLGNYFTVLRDDYTSAYRRKDIPVMKSKAREMMGVLDDLDTLMSTRPEFLLGKWIADAKNMGISAGEKNYFEKNARTLLTTWGAEGSRLTDYANRNWAGLISGYYKKRWSLFIQDVNQSAITGHPFDEKAFYKKVTAFEWNWTLQHDPYPANARGNVLEICRRLDKKYAASIYDNRGH